MRAKQKNIFAVSIFLVSLFVYPVQTNAQTGISPCVLFPTAPECNTDRDSVIVVPGIVGSYNTLALFADRAGGVWGPVPFMKIYQGLMMRLESEGLVKDEDLFIAYYDWRKSNVESARDYLAPIIEQAKQKTGRVDIIAHSMGGLLIQQYINSDQYTPGEIDQFVMLGTPNNGASAAYLPWEGGIFPTTWSVPSRLYMHSIAFALQKIRAIQDDEPKLYRQVFPSLKELLRVDTYITKDDTGNLSTERNTFLETVISARDNLLNSEIGITTIAGVENNTLDTIQISNERDETDEQLERWRDGRPAEEVPAPNNTEGDLTVLASSALFGPNPVTVGNIEHNDLPERAQTEALRAIGTESDKPEIFTYQEPEWLTGFVVLSPVDIVITDSTGKTVSKDVNDFGEDAFVDMSENNEEDDPKVIILRNLPPGTYTIHLTGTGTGEYTVITTHTNDTTSESETLTGNTTPGKEETFTVEIEDNGDDIDVSSITELKPVEQKFFLLHGRMPTIAEWKYWLKKNNYTIRHQVKMTFAIERWKARGR